MRALRLGRDAVGAMSITELLATTLGTAKALDQGAIQAWGLSKTYPGASSPAVHELDLSVRSGEIMGVLGPNGAGKTTTIGMLTTRVAPTSGRATILDLDVRRAAVAVRGVIGVTSQNNTLDRQLTVAENLYYHGRLFGLPARASRRASDELLDAFDLADVARSSVTALSGGMARRLMIARAIMHSPAVLFLDEPTTGLDPKSRRQVWELLDRLRLEGLTIVVTTHYMEEADRLCDRVAVMNRGVLAALDTPAALKGSVGGAIVTVVSNGPAHVLADAFAATRGEATLVRELGDRVELRAPTTRGLAESVVAAAAAVGQEISTLSIAQPSLEDVFLTLTGEQLAS